MTKLVGPGSKHGSTWLGRVGDVTKRPPAWVGMAGAIALTGPRGRRAAMRGSAFYVAGTAAHLAVKVVVGRTRPPGASRHTSIGPITSSFPSGHCASELAFSLGAAQEVPWLFVPLYAATIAAEWSLVRSRAHYPSDIFAGAAISVVIALVAWRMWPPDRVAFPGPEEAPDGPGLQTRTLLLRTTPLGTPRITEADRGRKHSWYCPTSTIEPTGTIPPHRRPRGCRSG